MRKAKPQFNLRIMIIITMLVAFVFIGFKFMREDPIILQGQIEIKEINIASKISGRVDKIYVKEGDKIKKGMTLLHLDSPEISAKVAQAEAVRDAANALAEKAQTGARTQEKEMALEQMQRAEAGLIVAQKTKQRISVLAQEGLVSRQKADEVNAQYISAKKLYEIAKAQYDMAIDGARLEDISAAQAKARQGQAVVNEALVAQNETNLESPVAGEVSEIIPNEGEIIAKGVPVVILADVQDQRLELNVREDYLHYFSIGQTFEATIPALNHLKAEFKVYSSSVLPDFATWRPTRTDEGFDMKTFLVKARPTTAIKNIRAGMSVLVELSKKKK